MLCVPNSTDATEGTCKPYGKSIVTTFGDAESDDECVENDCEGQTDCKAD